MDASGEDVGVVNEVMDEERFSAHAARGESSSGARLDWGVGRC